MVAVQPSPRPFTLHTDTDLLQLLLGLRVLSLGQYVQQVVHHCHSKLPGVLHKGADTDTKQQNQSIFESKKKRPENPKQIWKKQKNRELSILI